MQAAMQAAAAARANIRGGALRPPAPRHEAWYGNDIGILPVDGNRELDVAAHFRAWILRLRCWDHRATLTPTPPWRASRATAGSHRFPARRQAEQRAHGDPAHRVG